MCRRRRALLLGLTVAFRGVESALTLRRSFPRRSKVTMGSMAESLATVVVAFTQAILGAGKFGQVAKRQVDNVLRATESLPSNLSTLIAQTGRPGQFMPKSEFFIVGQSVEFVDCADISIALEARSRLSKNITEVREPLCRAQIPPQRNQAIHRRQS